MDFDKPKVYGDTFISDGLVFFLTTRSRSLLYEASVPSANYATPSLGHRDHYLLKHSTHSIDPL